VSSSGSRNYLTAAYPFVTFIIHCVGCWLVSGEQSSEVLKRPLHSGYRCQQPTSMISQPASADCTTLSEDYTWPLGFLCCSLGLELTTDQVSQSVH